MSEKKLTAKQELFVQEYLANGMKLSQAYMAAYPNANEKTANKESWKLIRKDTIKARIRELQHERFEALSINADSIATQLKEIALSEDASYSERMRALELIQKQMGLQTQKVEAEVKTVSIKVNLDEDGDD